MAHAGPSIHFSEPVDATTSQAIVFFSLGSNAINVPALHTEHVPIRGAADNLFLRTAARGTVGPGKNEGGLAAPARGLCESHAGVDPQHVAPLILINSVNSAIGRQKLDLESHARGVLRKPSRVLIASSCETLSAAFNFLTSSADKRNRVVATPSLGIVFTKFRAGFLVRFLSCIF